MAWELGESVAAGSGARGKKRGKKTYFLPNFMLESRKASV